MDDLRISFSVLAFFSSKPLNYTSARVILPEGAHLGTYSPAPYVNNPVIITTIDQLEAEIKNRMEWRLAKLMEKKQDDSLPPTRSEGGTKEEWFCYYEKHPRTLQQLSEASGFPLRSLSRYRNSWR